MTDIVTPPTIDALPPAPQPTDTPSEFDSKAFALLAAQVAMVGDFNSAAAATQQNATAANERAVAAASSAATAAGVSDAVLAAANFKGLWGGLSGALPKPATVKHNGRFWMLLNSLPNVAASEPGVSADWTSMDAGAAPTQLVTSSLTMVPGVRYLVTTPGITLTVPTGLIKSDYIGWRECLAVDSMYTVDFGSTKLRGVAHGSVLIEAKNGGTDMNYEDATRGLV